MTLGKSNGKRRLFFVLRILKWILMGVMMAFVFAVIFGILVKWIWSVTLTPLFGLATPSYWQAVGIVILARLIIGGFHGGNYKKNHRFTSNHKNGNRPFAHDFFYNQFHQQGNDDDVETFEIPRDLRHHYREFWKKEGKEAFKAYVAGLKTEKIDSDD